MNHPLAERRCEPLEGHPAMTPAEIADHLSRASGWSLHGDAIQKTFVFDDFHRTMAFVNALAWIAHADDHHPDLAVSYSRCSVRFNTHSVGGISINDFICAAKVDALITP